jgi:hypothetical protein
MTRSTTWTVRIALAALVLAAAALAGAATASASRVHFVDIAGTAEFKSERSGTFAKDAVSIPTWSSSFVDGLTGQSFNYTMVGRSPMDGSSNTVVGTMIVPVDLRFESSGGVLNGSSRTQLVLGSPIFQSALFDGPSYATQYGNAMHKDMFWATGGSNPAYNVTLENTGVMAPVRVDVPKSKGHDLIGQRTGIHFALADYAWLSNRLKDSIKDMSPTVVPIFIVDNTFLWLDTPDQCCVVGFHGALGKNKQISTYIFASYSDAGLFDPLPGQPQSYEADIHALSHEVSEWYADPFLSNEVVPWSSPLAPQYGCTNLLETGDPVFGYGWNQPMPNGVTYHPEDEAFFSWFAHESPSRGFAGRYTYLNTFTSPAPGC